MSAQIRRIEAGDVESFHACLDSVAKEGIYIAKDRAPDLERLRAFVESNIGSDVAQYVAVENGEVVGWCDAMSSQTKSLRHRAELGMGVIKNMRGKGLGEKLLAATLEDLRRKGVTRVELEVRADNERAIGLYMKMGFAECARKKLGIFQQGTYHDLVAMELFL